MVKRNPTYRLCIYCHDAEHQRQTEAEQGYTASDDGKSEAATFNPFADLKAMMENNDK